jgi:hypothetical protein
VILAVFGLAGAFVGAAADSDTPENLAEVVGQADR